MSALPHVDPLDANWRILQGHDKPFTARALARDATQQRRRRHGSKCYKDNEEHSANPHQRLSLVASGLQMPEVTYPDLAFEPISTVPDEPLDAVEETVMSDTSLDFDGGIALELIGEQAPEEFLTELPDGFHLIDGGRSASRQQMLQRLQHVAQIDFDRDDPEHIYSLCEPRYLPCS